MLFRNGVYPYEYLHDWRKFHETSLPEKKDFHSNLSMKDITEADHAHGKRVCKDIKVKYLGRYHDLCVKSATLLLADVFENF